MSQRITALVFAVLMLVGIVPPGEATHVDGLTPDVPILPRAKPTQDCLPTGVSEQVLARANLLLDNDPRFFTDEFGVPSLCVTSGTPLDEYEALIRDLDNVLEFVRNASREVQRQVDGRLEATLPEGENACKLSATDKPVADVPLACGLVEPRTVLLSESFDEHRIGGFGEWKVVTQGGEDPLWTIESTPTPNGTRHAYRFGSATDYVRGAHQWLVSPEIDLTALNGNQTAIQLLLDIRAIARGFSANLCSPNPPPPAPTNAFLLCGEGQTIGGQISLNEVVIKAYQAEFDRQIESLPVMQHGAYVNLTFRMNLAPGEDGVRLWLFSGDRQPDQRLLFSQGFGVGTRSAACPTDPAVNQLPGEVAPSVNPRSIVGAQTNSSTADVICTKPLQGGTVVMNLPGQRTTRAFDDPLRPGMDVAFTGNTSEFVTVRLNLTEFMDRRVWLLFEVKTLRNDRGIDIFSDLTRFARPKDFGFELSNVYAEGSGFHRNVRLKDIGATFTYQLDGNEFLDTNTTRTTLPPGNESIVVYLHNAGDYRENATFTMSVGASPPAAAPVFSNVGSYAENVSLLPDEVRTLTIPWSAVLDDSHPTLREKYLYALHGNLTVFEREIPPLGEQADGDNLTRGNLPSIADPNATRVRPANAAGVSQLGAGNLTLDTLVRAATLRNLTAIRADGGRGLPLEFCSSVLDRVCEPRYPDGGRGHYAGTKGEPRKLLVGVRNDGNAPQDAVAEIYVELGGVPKPDVVTDGARRELSDLLPGENRPLTWTLVPTEPGAYRVALSLERGDGTKEPLVERRLFVQRSTGLICLDTLDVRECGPSWAGALAKELREENITASAVAPDGRVLVATELREEQGGVHSGQLAAYDAQKGNWTILANLSGTRLNTTFAEGPEAGRGWGSIRSIVVAPDGALWLVGDNATALRRSAAGVLTRVPVHFNVSVPAGEEPVAPHVDLTAAVWHNGTLLAGGTGGAMLRFNGTHLANFTLYNETEAGTKIPYRGAVRALARAPNGFAYLVGDHGVALANDPAKAITSWSSLSVDGVAIEKAIGHLTLRAVGVRDGPETVGARVYLAGDGVILVNKTGSSVSFELLEAPGPLFPSESYVSLAQGAQKELLLVAARGGGYDKSANVGEFFPEVPSGVNLTHVCAFVQRPGADVNYTVSVDPSTSQLFNGTIRTTASAGWACDELPARSWGPLNVTWTNTSLFITRTGGNASVAFSPTRPGEGDSYTRDSATHPWVPQREWTRAYRLVFAGDPPIVVDADPGIGVDLARTSIVGCSPCDGADALWNYAELPLPPVVSKGSTHPARPHALVAGARSFAVGEAGVLLELAHRGAYENTADWTTVPALAARDGGVIQTMRRWNVTIGTGTGASQSYLGVPSAEGLAVATQATKFRLELNHHVRFATPSHPVEARIVYRNVPQAWVGVAGPPKDVCGPQLPACHAPPVRIDVARFERATDIDGWEWSVIEDVPASNGGFYGIELFADERTAWAIDDLRLQGFAAGQWQDVIAWYGPQKKTGEWYYGDLNNFVAQQAAPPPESLQALLRDPTEARWIEWPVVFDRETVSAWHATTQYADKPVFAANNEAYPTFTGGNNPRLLSNWDTRLVSPVIDLRDAYDPVVTFRHTYSFRTYNEIDGEDRDVTAGDGGVIEIQYVRRGIECGAPSDAVTCGWSTFFPVRPDDAYPTMEDYGYKASDYKVDADIVVTPPLPWRIHPERAYWGRLATPDERGAITSPRLTDTYEPVRMTLSNLTCSAGVLETLPGLLTDQDVANDAATPEHDCMYSRLPDGRVVPVNLSGRQIRVAFHLMTAGENDEVNFQPDGTAPPDGRFNHTDPNVPASRSIAGEGWYITDFKVLGAKTLGIDLAATNMSFRVGYDPHRIGVGPGTVVPVNVTVENHGTFDALGYTAELEVRRVLNRGLGETQLVETITLPQQPVLEVGASANHTLLWNVPGAENAEYALSVRVDPIGIDRDEDFLDNVASLGTVATPILAKTVRRYATEFLVSPENATVDITRYMPMYINNTGNVPVDGFQVERRITVIGRLIDDDAKTCADWLNYTRDGRRTAIVDCRTWTTARPAPAGTLTPLTAISNDVSPTADLFWKAPERASFLVAVVAKTKVGTTLLSSAADRRVSAFATYLFDDVEGGQRGEADSGAWRSELGWNVTQPGFRSTDAYGFGDATLQRYAPDANASMVSPTIDLSTARTASLAFYHQYDFEGGFDGGVLEASDDDGKTWYRLTPLEDARTRAAYDRDVPVQASSPAHPSGDPDLSAYAFTGRSADLPASVEGWALSQVDFTNFPNVTEPGAVYEQYGSPELQSYDPADSVPARIDVYSSDTWGIPCTATDFRCWEIEDLTRRTPVTPPVGTPEDSMWWSGSVSLDDDDMRPIQNNLLSIPVDISTVQADQLVEADWWEYTSRFDEHAIFYRWGDSVPGAWPDPKWPDDLLTTFAFQNDIQAPKTYRINLGRPEIVETRGQWYHMHADLTPLVAELRNRGLNTLDVGFAYTPLNQYSSLFGTAGVTLDEGRFHDAERDETSGGHYGGPSHEDSWFLDDRGLAVDGFKLTATRLVRGQAVGAPQILADEASVGTELAANLLECSVGHVNALDAVDEFNAHTMCLDGDALDDQPWIRRTPVTTGKGRNWAVVTELPPINSTWRVVDVKGPEAGDAFGGARATGEKPKAWWTGEISDATGGACAFPRGHVCPRPGSESRLVTPAFDLGRIAGNDAQLAFTHRYGFKVKDGSAGGLHYAAGGVVEIQEYDALTGTWSAWKQIYTKPDNLTIGKTTSLPSRGDRPTPTEPRNDHRGGYTFVTANRSVGSEGTYHFDPPFENVVAKDKSNKSIAVQFLYSGLSTAVDEDGSPGDPTRPDGWMRESFDVSRYLGKKVRFGFHAAWMDETAKFQSVVLSRLDDVDKPGEDLGGWWVTDVAITGNVIIGKPVQVRWRAGTDANVEAGGWVVDDIGVFGSRYTKNLGLFVDRTPERFGAYPNATVTIPITLRNLGVRIEDDLVIEVINTDPAVPVTLGVVGAPSGGFLDEGIFRIPGLTLGPGQSTTVNVTVASPKDTGAKRAPLLFTLKVQTIVDGQTVYASIKDNEVQGLLSRKVDVHLQKDPAIELVSSVIRRVSPQVGEAVDLELTYLNRGFGPTSIEVTCNAQSIKEWKLGDHRQGTRVEEAIVLEEYLCEKLAGNTTVAAKGTTKLVYRVTPTVPGFLSFAYNVSIPGVREIPVNRTGIAVGVSPLAWKIGFDSLEQATGNFSSVRPGQNARWDHLRGHDGTGALYLGVSENLSAQGAEYDSVCGGGVCRAIGPPVDLHNFSNTTPAFLSFWHQDRLAKYDGAQVKAQWLKNEQRPNAESSWSEHACVLRPAGGYEGAIRQWPEARTEAGERDPTKPSDVNPVFRQASPQYGRDNHSTGTDFFVTAGGKWENGWALAVFDLRQPCEIIDSGTQFYNETTLVGQTVRFVFEMFPGAPEEVLHRGSGHAFLVDDITVGPLALDVRPDVAQRASLLDNTTKGFNVVVRNVGAQTDRFVLEFDERNSSVPAGTIAIPADPIDLEPNRTRIVTARVTLPRDPSLLPTDFKVRLYARSLLDRNAGGDATLDLAFGPRPWAELAIVAEAPGGIVQEGTEAFIPITLENNGLVDSVPSRIRIVDTWGVSGRAESVLELPSIPSYAQSPEDSTRVFEFRWRPEKGSVGLHTLRFEADPDMLGEEYTRTNNLVTLAIPVSDLLIPDLHVANLSALTLRNAAGGVVSPVMDADVARYEVAAGELVTFQVNVANKGRAGATNVDVRAFIGALSLPPKTIPYIAAGSESVVSFNWVAQKGEHEIEVVVRSEQVELSTANNRYPGVGVTLLTVKGYEVEIDIPDLLHLLEPGAVAQVPFSIRNLGNAGEDLVLRAKTPGAIHLQLPREGFFLRSGETYDDTARLVLDAEAVAGQQFITIEAVARENPMKVASGRGALRVNASFGGSVSPALAVGAPPRILLAIELVNEGNSLEPWTIVPQLPAGWSAEEKLPAKIAVPAHARATLDLHLKVPESTAPGERVVAIKATLPNGERRDGLARVSVSPLRAAGIVVQEVAPKPERGSLTVPVVVENTGNVRQPFSVVLLDAPNGMELKMEPATFDLPPGGRAVAELVVRPNDTLVAGTYAIMGYTHFQGVAPQSAEGLANLQTLRVPIVRQDLRLSPLEYAPRAGLDAGDRVSVKVGVTNRGLTEIVDVPVHLYVDDVFIEETRIPAIAAGARVDATFNWTAVVGPHTLTVVVDPYSDTVEADRADNAVSALATVGAELPTGGVAAGRADTPGLGVLGAIAALGVALLATRSLGSRRQRR